jgi:ribosomal protein L11 methyltransferase
MVVLSVAVPEGERDQVVADLWEAGTCGIIEGEHLRAFFEDEAAARRAAERLAAYEPFLEPAEEKDWVAESRAAFPPIEVGDRLFLAPYWSDAATPAGRLRLTTYPGAAAGTGQHPTTQLCLRALERVIFDGARVLDVGCGSGILSAGAKLLGAGVIFGCDIDHAATRIARDNLRAEGIPAALFTGSVRSVRPRSVDIAVANLNAATLVEIAYPLSASAKTLVLSGFRTWEAPRVQSAFRKPAQCLEQEDWSCLIIQSTSH